MFLLDKKSVLISASGRVSRLPPYLFAELDRKKAAVARKGVDIIDFGIGDPDLPTPDFVVSAASEALRDPAFHRYPRNEGSPFFLDAASAWMSREFGVEPGEGVSHAAVIGTKEGIAHVPVAFCNPGDVVLVPSPGYPVYRAAAILADAVPVEVPLRRENGFLPDLDSLEPSILKSARMIYLNYPNNPTGAVMSGEDMRRIVEFARREDLLIVSDNSYSHIRFDGGKPASFLQIEGAAPLCLEFHSLSKTFSMTGWRIGFVTGGTRLVKAFMSAKENIDSGVFTAIQKAGAAALASPPEAIADRVAVYARRRALLIEGLRKLSWDVCDCPASLYLWAAVPKGWTSIDFASWLITASGIVVTPGSGFGTWGEGYVRFSLTLPEERIHKALGRLEQLEFHSLRGRTAMRRSRKCQEES